jgi:hypothetical protein
VDGLAGVTVADADWLSYAGAIAGVVGAITGIAGSVLGYIAYRRSDELKALDLRLELRKNTRSLADEANELIPLLQSARKSKAAVSAANGTYRSGATEKWMAEWERDKKRVEEFLVEVPNPEDKFLGLSPSTLETKLVEVHRLKQSAFRVRTKYSDSVAEDESARAQIAAARGHR